MNTTTTDTLSLGQRMLAESKFYTGYSRWRDDVGAFESWNESVGRVMGMHRDKYAKKMTPVLEALIAKAQHAYEDKLILGAQRALQFGGEQLRKHEAKMYNCLEKNTKFVTSSGVRTFADFTDGDSTVVLTHTGAWRPAKVRSYGEQQLAVVTLKRGNHQTTVRATKDHRWLLKDGSETTALKQGDNLLKPFDTFAGFDYESASPDERLYWCYGMVYGDGTRVKNKDGVYAHSLIRLCGKDKQFVSRFEEMGFKTSTNQSLKGDCYAYTGTYLKTAPDPAVDSPELIRAFVAGYLQADGAKSRNNHGTKYVSIQATGSEQIAFIRKCFPIAGAWIISERDMTAQETNFGVRGETVSFRVSDSMGSKFNSGWVVESVEPSEKETVWCLEVEEDHSFVMPNGVVTGNCSASHADRAAFFQEAMYLLLCGCGVGFSVQKRHVSKLPKIQRRSEAKAKVFTVPDSIEGWADAFGVLLSSYFEDGGTFPEYKGSRVHFDFSKVREKGALISGGFKAPGPDGLRKALERCEALLEKALGKKQEIALRPIVVYDFVMHMSDAVLSGGVRRSATICLFDKDDREMLEAKTGNWQKENPQRGRSNNSVVLKRGAFTRKELARILKKVREFGEPGFVFVEDYDICYNPCVEIGMLPIDIPTGESGFQFCNLAELNGSRMVDPETFYRGCEAGAIMGTLQAGYTNFKYLGAATRRITEREALIGVSITGWMNNPHVLFDEAILKRGAEIVKETNRIVAKLIGIRPAARTTCVKPAGNASILLCAEAGIHGAHSPRYFRNVQLSTDDEVAQLIARTNPKMVEKSVWSANDTDVVVSFPVVAKSTSKYKSELLGVKQLEFVKKAQQHWIENGTNVDLCTHPKLRHNVSNTITVDDWDEVEEYIFENQQWFAGISLMAGSGDKAFAQAPFTEVRTADEILKLYGVASMMASGLIVDGKHAFNDNLWAACTAAMKYGVRLTPALTMAALDSVRQLTSDEEPDVLKRDWIRRFHKFATNHFGGDLQKTEFCLKDLFNLHKWVTIERELKEINFTEALTKQVLVDADTLASQACAGGACELVF